MNKIRITIGTTVFLAASLVAASSPVSANYLTKCTLTEGRSSATTVCTSVKKSKGTNKLRVATTVKCDDGTGYIMTFKDKTPAKALKQSTAYCGDGMILIDATWEIVA